VPLEIDQGVAVRLMTALGVVGGAQNVEGGSRSLVIPSLLYMADQEFAGGRYTVKFSKAGELTRHWLGI
jgi:hypothetical protein